MLSSARKKVGKSLPLKQRRLTDEATPIENGKPMISIRTLTCTFLLMQLVVSSACFIASLAIISAKMNSTSIHEEKQFVSFEWWIFCVLSFLMIVSCVVSMRALSEHNKLLLLPHIGFLILCNMLACYVTHFTIRNFDATDFNWFIGLCGILSAESFLLICLIIEIRALRTMT
ncbi:unnamed protein product [Caenorhabditis bovis]|uniref:Uncharacterized protein n=1 Tax=Caenorhabditis bovis TaxID=2654633 RepID=A0A8S1FCB8_9PELO|nr:unnamed protein product [Caenorhabditis bovis]